MILSLCGFMGAGKSTIGKNVSYLLGFHFIDLDKYIEHSCGKTISALFLEVGLDGFRRIEHDELEKLLKNIDGDTVLSLGGGAVTYRQTADIVIQQTNCIYLRYDIGVLYKRLLKNHAHRPLLAGKSPQELNQFIKQNIVEREPHYLRCASLILDCDGKSISQVCGEIAERFGYSGQM